MLRGKLIDDLTFGAARRRRLMHRRLRELDRLDASEPGSSSRIREGIRTSLVAVGTGTLVTAMVLLTYGSPLGHPPEATAAGGTFRFSGHQPGSPDRPIAYDPCETIEIVVNDARAPEGSGALFNEALHEVSAATGLVLEVTGRTDERIGPGHFSEGRAAPVLVDWTSAEHLPGLEGEVAGLAGSTAVVTGPGQRHLVTGTVALDAPALAGILRRPDGPAQVEAIIKHELGHIVGLDHVNDANELMNEENLGLTGFGPGDLEGLAELGAGRCSPGL